MLVYFCLQKKNLMKQKKEMQKGELQEYPYGPQIHTAILFSLTFKTTLVHATE